MILPKNTADLESRYESLALSTKQKQHMTVVYAQNHITAASKYLAMTLNLPLLYPIGRILPDQPK